MGDEAVTSPEGDVERPVVGEAPEHHVGLARGAVAEPGHQDTAPAVHRHRLAEIEESARSAVVAEDAPGAEGGARQAISILELPLPEPRPESAQWIETYRRWARRG